MNPDFSYDLNRFEADIQKIKPRFFDTYLLPGFILYYAVRSKREMNKKSRRILFASGVYMFYRNYNEYKKAFENIKTVLNRAGQTGRQA